MTPDWQHPVVGKLTAIVQSMDDEALAQLANAGLLRRARKDVAAAPPRLAIYGTEARVETGGQTGTWRSSAWMRARRWRR